MAEHSLLIQTRALADGITAPVKSGLRKLRVLQASKFVIIPFFVHFNAEFGSSIGGLLPSCRQYVL